MTIKELAREVASLKQTYEESKAITDAVKEDYEARRTELLQGMVSIGAKSLEADNYVISKAMKTSINVVDESAAMEWLNGQDIDPNYYIGLKKDRFNPLAKLSLSSTGEIPDGCEVKHEEYLSLRERKYV